MKKIMFLALALGASALQGYTTWITNNTGYDIRVKLFGHGRVGSSGEYWSDIKAGDTERREIDHGGYCLQGFSVDILPQQECKQMSTPTSAVQVNVNTPNVCPNTQKLYTHDSLSALGMYQDNPSSNHCAGVTMNVSLVQIHKGPHIIDGQLRATVTDVNGKTVEFASAKLSEISK